MSRRSSRRQLPCLQSGYVCILPWTGYLALLGVPGAAHGMAQLSGWILLLVWQVLVLGALATRIPDARRQPARSAWMLAPMLLCATQSWSDAGHAVLNAAIELSITEFAALLGATVVLMLIKPGRGKAVAWPGILLLSALTGVYLYALISGWRLLNPDPDWLRQSALIGAFASQFATDWRWIAGVADGRLKLAETLDSERALFAILGQIAVWLVLPLALTWQ